MREMIFDNTVKIKMGREHLGFYEMKQIFSQRKKINIILNGVFVG